MTTADLDCCNDRLEPIHLVTVRLVQGHGIAAFLAKRLSTPLQRRHLLLEEESIKVDPQSLP